MYNTVYSTCTPTVINSPILLVAVMIYAPESRGRRMRRNDGHGEVKIGGENRWV